MEKEKKLSLTKEEKAYQERAYDLYHKEGEIEIDVGAGIPKSTVSLSPEGGAYVMAWVWVPRDEPEKKK